ncbi:spermine/spermidine synthase [Paenibacillus sediminis]|uniref:Spermidine synthase n=1 Tax=Paenibacillus sediminis TaxID=664909 RepID=A0ABS4H0E8_9BACL|nr:spermine/spermidine synthase [Paenibacillus sediminis]MBP1935966.1 spermidine synthase [Paenibacillus sediminis]
MNDFHEAAVVIERAVSTRGEIQLQRRGSNYEVISNGTFLMATYNGESEKLLVRSALQAVQNPRHVLIGGLGVGYSLQEATQDPRVEQVTVIEIEPKIIEWNDTVLAHITNHATRHPKANIVNADLIDWLEHNETKFDLICLDIDNGPDWKVYEQNSSLYSHEGILLTARHLTDGGCLTFWSATASPEFVARLQEDFSHVEVLTVPQERGEPDYIFLVKKTDFM